MGTTGRWFTRRKQLVDSWTFWDPRSPSAWNASIAKLKLLVPYYRPSSWADSFPFHFFFTNNCYDHFNHLLFHQAIAWGAMRILFTCSTTYAVHFDVLLSRDTSVLSFSKWKHLLPLSHLIRSSFWHWNQFHRQQRRVSTWQRQIAGFSTVFCFFNLANSPHNNSTDEFLVSRFNQVFFAIIGK